MNPLLEKRFVIFSLIIFTGILSLSSYYNPSGASGYVASPFDKVLSLARFGTYALTFLLLIARLKSVIRAVRRDLFLVFLMVLVVISPLWSDFPAVSRKQALLTLLTTLFGLYLASRFSIKEQVHLLAWALGIATVFSFLYTLALPGSGIEQGLHAGAWRGTFVQKNLFSRFMVASVLPLFLVALSSRKYRYILWTIFGIAVVLILLTKSKSALLIFLTLMVLVPLYKALRVSHSITVPLFITAILIAGSVGVWLVTNWEPFLLSLGKDTTLTGRTYIWEAVIDKIGDRPWLGYGYQAFFAEGGVGQKAVWHAIHIYINQAHNGYINIAADLGLLGLLFFSLSLLSTYLRAIHWVRLTKNSEALWPLLYVTFIFMYNQSETTNLETNSILWIFYAAAAFSVKHLRVVEVDENTENLKRERWLEEAVNA
ncbi:MAG TPA: O-antigen polymerase [Cyanobacteria bacterium UBA11162]|nr:O-antigen polymerase [Cyanobacteria bacterium UBA11162]